MANTTKNATCPVCGYREDAMDATALQSAMEEHMRSAHNLSMSTLNTGAAIKEDKHADNDAGNAVGTILPLGGAGIAGNNNRANE